MFRLAAGWGQPQAPKLPKIFYPKNKKELLLRVTPSSKMAPQGLIQRTLRFSKLSYQIQFTVARRKIYRHRALGRAPVSCLHQSPRLGAGLLWRQPRSAGFQLILLRVQLCLWLAAGCGRLQATASFNKYLKIPGVRCLAFRQLKYHFRRRDAKLLTHNA